ncbi:Multidrug resistance-associated protein 1 [Nymphon striatum]|nr:Multidrug resistance-associated protein 1 [Nymphon striatum]
MGVDRSLYLARRVDPNITRKDVREADDAVDIVYLVVTLIIFPLTLASFFLTFISDRISPQTLRLQNKNNIGYRLASASYPSKLIFAWVFPLIFKGYKQDLMKDEIWSLRPSHESKYVYHQFMTQFTKSKEKIKNHNEQNPQNLKHVSLSWSLWRAFWPEVIYMFCLRLFCDANLFLNPFLLNLLILFMSTNEPAWHGILYALGLYVVTHSHESGVVHYNDSTISATVRIKGALSMAIFNKALKLSNSARQDYSVGELVNLMAVDLQKFEDFLTYTSYVLISPFMLCLGIYFLWTILGPSCLAGVAVIILLAPGNYFMVHFAGAIQDRIMHLSDDRLKFTNEIINGIKVLKLYAWEIPFAKKLYDIRERETSGIRKYTFLFAGNEVSWELATFLISFCSLATYVLVDEKNILTPNVAFVSLALFNIIRVPMMLLPSAFSSVIQALVSIKRLNKFLNAEELDCEVLASEDLTVPLSIENGSFSWGTINKEPVLKNISINVKSDELVAVVGRVGSGKSSLLSAFLGEMKKQSGTIKRTRSVAYVPQQAWILNDSIKNNITFSSGYNHIRYREVIKACALQPDLDVLPAGDQTEIGEKGVNISGGQKQRVSLARAVYNNSELFLLDDPLSAVDANVGSHLFKHVIGPSGLLKNKTRIITTNSIAFLHQCDRIVVMNEGSITEMGTFNDLMQNSEIFSELIQTYSSNGNGIEKTEKDVNLDDGKAIDRLSESNSVASYNLITETHDLYGKFRTKSSSLSLSSGSKINLDNVLFQRSAMLTLHFVTISLIPGLQVNLLCVVMPKGRLIEDEDVEVGTVKMAVYWTYVKQVGLLTTFCVLLTFLLYQGFVVGANVWLSIWSNEALVSQSYTDYSQYLGFRVGIFGMLGLLSGMCLLIALLTLAYGHIKACAVLHNFMLDSILHAPMSFFDTTPTGRIMNRFSKDINTMDTVLLIYIRLFLLFSFNSLGAIFVIVYELPTMLSSCVSHANLLYPDTGGGDDEKKESERAKKQIEKRKADQKSYDKAKRRRLIQESWLEEFTWAKLFLKTSRQLKRMESVSSSPLYSQFSESVYGASSIRAYECHERFFSEFQGKLNQNQCAYYGGWLTARWMEESVVAIGSLIVFFTSLFIVIFKNEIDPGSAGLSVSYALNMMFCLTMCVQFSSDIETKIVSAERILEYSQTMSEAAWDIPNSKPQENWPQRGEIIFDNYKTRYRPDLESVLKGINLHIKPGEKIGVCGRTGAGKSSLTLSLFRIIEASSGKIVLDNCDISMFGLHDLRSKLTIIPQDPVLFTGNIRFNLDPLQINTDDEIWNALRLAYLKDFVSSLGDGLEYQISEGGGNMSVGQRQLICLTRALLRKTKVLILDEATAAVDLETDSLIQETIRKEFADCTIVTIAHRLNTIMDSSRIVVLDNGQIAEFDTPSALLENKSSMFYSMIQDSSS